MEFLILHSCPAIRSSFLPPKISPRYDLISLGHFYTVSLLLNSEVCYLFSDAQNEENNMRCPHCGCEDLKVVDSRPSESNDAIRRRRECVKCGFRFTTYERREEIPLLVVKKDKTKEPFDRQKLMRGLMTATVKRSVQISELENLIDEIQSELRDEGLTEISSSELGNRVLKRLLDLDKVAYVRFASVYRDFKDLDEFSEELRSLAHE